MELRVDADELVETEDSDSMFVHWNGQLFTGIAVSTYDGTTMEKPFLNGAVHGHCVRRDATGRVIRDYTMEHGMFVGDDRAWWPDGTLRWHRVRGRHPHYSERSWTEAGVLVIDRDDAIRKNFTWYDDGTLRCEALGDLSRSYARDGELLLTACRPRGGSDTVIFENDAMERRLFELLVDPDWWHVGLGFLRTLATQDRPRGVAQMRRVLTGDNGLAKIDIAWHGAELGLVELIPDLTALLDDDTIPPFAPTSHGGRRGYSSSVGHAARAALDRLSLR